METLKAVVTYRGNILDKLGASSCPRRLLERNTEQEVEVFGGGGFRNRSLMELLEEVKPKLLAECAKNGEVIGLRWYIVEGGQ